jgi:hypothetical protein
MGFLLAGLMVFWENSPAKRFGWGSEGRIFFHLSSSRMIAKSL